MAEIYDITEELTSDDNCFCFLTPNSSVLEFGSATGYATRYMKEKFNCRVTCIEANEYMASIGKKYADEMIVADVEKDNWETKITDQYDFIIFADILEHLHNPNRLIQRAKKYLKNNGFILTSIPNIGHNAVLLNLRSAKFDYKETGLLDNTHIHLFTRDSIVEMFRINDFFCVDENNKNIRPCETEFETYYIKKPLFSLSVINKDDAHVYRFVQKWSNDQSLEIHNKTIQMSFYKKIFELVYDIGCYIKRKMNISTPRIISLLLQKDIKK